MTSDRSGEVEPSNLMPRPARRRSWRLGHLLLIILASAIALAVWRTFWGPTWRNAKVVFGAYLASVVVATIAAAFSEPRWRRPWLGFALFGWAWIVLVLWHYLGLVPDIYASNLISFSALGAALGLISALTTLFLPGLREI